MRALVPIVLAALSSLVAVAPATAAGTVTARVTGAIASVHTGPDTRFPIVGQLADGTVIEVDYCTQTDRDSDRGSRIGMAGHTLWPRGAKTFCRIPDYGWVARNEITGRGLSTITPPDFSGPGW